jgi:hypothetical protein
LVVATAVALAYHPTTPSDPAVVPVEPDPAASIPAPPGTVPLPNHGTPVVEAVFVLDTTGSMSGLLQAAKDRIWSIASTMATAEPQPQLRIGLVAYRDRGDDYVTKVIGLSADLDLVHAELFQLTANGGGDGPEHVNQALHDAVHRIDWSEGQNVYRTVFLVGDAPPHMDYQDDVKYPETLTEAKRRGIHVNALQAGADPSTTKTWTRIARLGDGDFFKVDADGGAVALASPYDAKLAALGAALDKTRIVFGSRDERRAEAEKRAATERLHAATEPDVLARRAEYKAAVDETALADAEADLVTAVASGRVDLDDVEAAELPAPMRAMTPEERTVAVQQQAETRAGLKAEIQALSKQRAAWISARLKEQEGGVEASLDHNIYRAVRSQAADSGLTYGADAAKY